jgi:hypothetical protein
VRIKKILLSLFLLLGFLRVNLVFANEEEIKKEIQQLKQRIAQLEEKLIEKDTEKEVSLSEVFKEISFNIGTAFIFQATHNANGSSLSKKGEDVNDASYSMDLEIEKKFSDYGKVYFHFEAGNGEGVTDELELFSNVNADVTGDENFNLIEAYYEHYFKTLPLTLTLGKLDATCFIDTNEYANDETTQFLADPFKNSPTIEFPDDNGPGVRFLVSPSQWLDLEGVLMDADGDWEDFLDDIFFAFQLNFKPHFFSKSGNFGIYAWLNNKEHTKWKDATKTKEKGYGLGISIDQKLADNLGVFLRYSWQNPKVYMNGLDFSLKHFYSCGFQFSGNLWKREDDVLGIGFSQIFPSEDYKKVNNLKAKSEKHLEIYYRFKVHNHFTLTPDVQIIWDPYGADAPNGNKTIVVGGIRIQVDF